MEKEIKLTIHIKTMDMFRFFMKHFYSGFSGIFGLILSLGAFVFLLFRLGKSEPFQILLLIILASLFTVLQPVQFLMKAYQQVKILPIYKIPLEYVLNDTGIHVKQNEETVDLPWENIKKVTECKKEVYIYTSAVHAFILPKSQMKEKEDAAKTILKEKLKFDMCKLK